MNHKAYIGLGANLGDARGTFRRVAQLLSAHHLIEAVRASGLYRTQPIGGPSGQPDYLNAVVEADTPLDPHHLLRELLAVEHAEGRRRDQRWGPRLLDLDLLLYGQQVIDDGDLQLPHPRMHLRRFVLEPLRELAPDLVHPELGRTIRELADGLNGAGLHQSVVRIACDWLGSARLPSTGGSCGPAAEPVSWQSACKA